MIETRIQELNDTFEAARKRVATDGKALLNEAIAGLFAQYPYLMALRWTQYTPYFNDGEPCVFRSNADDASAVMPRAQAIELKCRGNMPKIDLETDEEEDLDGQDEPDDDAPPTGDPADLVIIDNYYLPEELRQAIKILGKIPDEVYLATFDAHDGDGKITAKRDGTFDVTYYEHD